MNRIAPPPAPLAATAEIRVLRPDVTVRPAHPEEARGARIWASVNLGRADALLELVEFRDGSRLHAPETVAACRAMLMGRPGATVVYVHRGAQAQCLTPLLPSLLHAIGHAGPATALRREPEDALPLDPMTFASVLSGGGAALVVDDEQRRIGPPGALAPAPVRLSLTTGDPS